MLQMVTLRLLTYPCVHEYRQIKKVEKARGKGRGYAHCAEHQLVCAITPVLQIMQLDLCAKGIWLL